MNYSIARQSLLGIGIKESFEIQKQADYLLSKENQFFEEFFRWYESLNLIILDKDKILNKNLFRAFIAGHYDEQFYIDLYHQALAWHSHGFNLSRAMLLLSNFRQQFVLIAEQQNNHVLAKDLCNSIDIGQAVVSDVYHLHQTLVSFRKRSQTEIKRIRRSFHLISSRAPEELVQAFIDHQNWKITAYACALGEVDNFDFAYSTHDCLLGKWLDSGGTDKIPTEEIENFLHYHEEVHRLGYLALKEASEQHPERIVEFLNEMELASDEVCRVLLECIEEEFILAANLDSLTNLPNRKAFDTQLNHNLALAKRCGLWVGLIVIDVDYFKNINDSFGHSYGDKVLIELASVIETIIRLEDNVYRWGGEEFAVLAMDKSAVGVEQLAERIRQSVEQTVFCEEESQSYKCTVSCGAISFHPEVDLFAKEVFELVDQQLFKAKELGRNRVSYITLE